MTAADWWRVGYGHEFASNVERIASSLEKQNKLLERLVKLFEYENEAKEIRRIEALDDTRGD